jgi:hypothetical protein
MAEQKAVRQAERGAGPDGLEHLRVELALSRVADQEQHQVALADHLEHLAQRAGLLAEAGGARRFH